MIICPVFKKGDRAECVNYRGILLLPNALKTYQRVLEKRTKTKTEHKSSEAQNGFRPGRGTKDLTFKMKMLIEKS